jgi:protein TonB
MVPVPDLRPAARQHVPKRGIAIIVAAVAMSFGAHAASAAYWYLNKEAWRSGSHWKKDYRVKVINQRPKKPKLVPPAPKLEAPKPKALRKMVRKPRALPSARPQPEQPPKEVFGMDKESFTDNKSAAIAQRAGNTQMKSQEADYTPPRQVPDLADTQPAPPPRPRPRLQPSTFNLSEVSERPRVLTWVRPQYTDAAQDEEVEGVVKVEVILDRTGKPVRARIVKGLGYGLDGAVKHAVMKSRFSPCKRRGMPVKCRLVIPNRFKLE